MNAIESIASQLLSIKSQHSDLLIPKSKTKKTVSIKEYDIFIKEFLFYQIKGESFGAAFCKRFEIDDWLLPKISDSSAKRLIEALGYLEDET